MNRQLRSVVADGPPLRKGYAAQTNPGVVRISWLLQVIVWSDARQRSVERRKCQRHIQQNRKAFARVLAVHWPAL